MSSKILIAAVIACSLTMFGCAQPDEVNVGDESSSSMSAVEATDACFASCMERPGATEERCAEACARIGGDTCLEGCVERGGDEADCQEICDEQSAASSAAAAAATDADAPGRHDYCDGLGAAFMYHAARPVAVAS